MTRTEFQDSFGFREEEDTAGKEPVKVYHAFMLGILSYLGHEYQIRSNQESGYGRNDTKEKE